MLTPKHTGEFQANIYSDVKRGRKVKMSEEQVQKPTDGVNQAPEEEIGNVDFGDDPSPENQTQTPEDNESSEQTEQKPINQEAVEKRINKLTFEKHEERRKREKLEADLAEIKAKLDKRQQKAEEVVIPDLPDVYDDDFDKKVAEREAALAKAAAIKERKAILEEQRRQEAQRAAEARNAEIAKQVDAMYSSAKEYGISKDELEQADLTVSQFIQNPDLAKFILAQKRSALIVKYLASSAVELEKIQNMDPLSASVYIATSISSEAEKLKPNVTRTPDPIDIPSGKSAPNEDPFLRGVKLE